MADAEEKKKLKEQLKAEKLAKKQAKKAEKLAKKEAKNAGRKDGKKTADAGKAAEQPAALGIMIWIIFAVVVIIGAGSGFFVGRLFAGSRVSAETTAQTAPPKNASGTKKADAASATAAEGTWFYNMQPVIANLNEPGVTRFVRATITMEVSNELQPAASDDPGKLQSNALLEAKKPVLENWLTIYLSGLSIDDTQGGKNKQRIQLQILDAFNEELFPNSKPLIKKILLKEFVIQ